jgi:hypothetical protein
VPLQLSSMPLHVSGGGVHAEADGRLQSMPHVPVPELPHVVVQVTELPWTHGNVSSAEPLQLSSRPLQVSAPAEQELPVGISHEDVQIPVPVVPQAVVHSTVSPLAQAKPLSAAPSQSSSTPLQVSAGAWQLAAVGYRQSSPHIPVPMDPQVVVHAVSLFMGQSNPSSMEPLQLSSMPLHTSSAETNVHSTSHPSDGSPLMSDHPGKHSKLHSPATHMGSALRGASQALPHSPQFSASMLVSTQLPEQLMRPGSQSLEQVPREQTSPSAQAFPQVPQLLTSESRSTHSVPQSVSPAPQGPSTGTSTPS